MNPTPQTPPPDSGPPPPAPPGHKSALVPALAIAVLLAFGALCVMAFQNVRRESQDKAVLCPLRQLSAAADQYFLENGVSTVDYAHLVGSSNYVKAVNTVAGETYPGFYTQGVTITVSGVAGARTVTYAP